jgi:hypothetical protein
MKTRVNGGFQRFLGKAMSLYVPLSKRTPLRAPGEAGAIQPVEVRPG